MIVPSTPTGRFGVIPKVSGTGAARPARLTVRVLVAVLAVMLAAHPEAASARVTVAQTTDAARVVRSTLSAVSRSGRLTADQRYRYRRSLRRAMKLVRRLDETGRARRRDELGSQIVMLATLAGRGALAPKRMGPLFRQLDANRFWFAKSEPPRRSARISVGGDPLVYAFYPGRGLQLQPLFNWTKVNGYWFARDYAGMRALIDRLAPLAVPQRGGWISWEYAFDYPGSRAPWLSGMAQGVAIQALARAWQATHDPEYLALARRALPGLGRPLAQGGLLGRSPGGRWWPLYAEQPSLRVLNGDLQTIISLYDYADITADTRALGWARDGAHAAVALLPKYDTGAWSLYQGSREANLGYHDLMTLQLRQLALRTGNLEFRRYADRFAQYREMAPVIAASIGPTPVIYPTVPDSPRAAATFRARLNKASELSLAVADIRGSIVAERMLGAHRRGAFTVPWDGFAHGRPVAPGIYQLWMSATDLAGNRSPRTFVGTAVVERDTKPPAVRALRIDAFHGQVRLRWRLIDDASAHVDITVSTGHGKLTLHDVPLAGRRTIDLAATRELVAGITVIDESGNRTRRTRQVS